MLAELAHALKWVCDEFQDEIRRCGRPPLTRLCKARYADLRACQDLDVTRMTILLLLNRNPRREELLQRARAQRDERVAKFINELTVLSDDAQANELVDAGAFVAECRRHAQRICSSKE